MPAYWRPKINAMNCILPQFADVHKMLQPKALARPLSLRLVLQPLMPAEVRSGDLHEPLQLAPGDKVTFTIVEGADGSDNRVSGGRLVACVRFASVGSGGCLDLSGMALLLRPRPVLVAAALPPGVPQRLADAHGE